MANNYEKVRLEPSEIKNILKTIKEFDKQAVVILFGSRTDLSKKGGDIDLLVLSSSISYKEKRKIKTTLLELLGDRKMDLIVTDDYEKSEFTKMAFNNGVKL